MKRLSGWMLLVAVLAMLLLASCNKNTEPDVPDVSDAPESPWSNWPPETTDVTLADYKAGFEADNIDAGHAFVHADAFGSYYNAVGDQPVYEYSYRPYMLENGITRVLSYRWGDMPTEDEWRYDVHCEVADFYGDRLIDIIPVDAASLMESAVRSYVYYEQAMNYGWLDQNHIYLSSRSRLGIVNLLTDVISVPTADPGPIYEAAGSHNSSYLAIVVEPWPMDGKLYYLSYRDPAVLNNYGDIYEADVNGERLMIRDVTGVLDVADGAIAYARDLPGDPEAGEPQPTVQALYCFDVDTGKEATVFADTWIELDDDEMIVDGVVIGNEWAGKTETYNNPPYIIEGRQLFFYVSRIGEEKVDRYVYDIATGNLLLQETRSADDYRT